MVPDTEPMLNKWCLYINIYMEYHSAIEKNGVTLLVATWMDIEIIVLSEVRSKRQIPHDITYM